ncbi:heavy-metal-associated domain-containing protein [Litoribaculum gwangyangense]|uniref:HMA domain-containing protein n=1 Tax=Litoribaculum gwangyangense TaxID=1130722 RepID=A0ABP9CN14_9FLAO
MKKLMILTMLLLATTTFAQNKNAKASIEVDGVCMMCKARIEKVCLSTKGVKSANWDVKTHELKLFFDENKTNLKTIQANIASAGHDTKAIKATEEAYNKVNACCKYRDEQVVKDHQN